MGAFNAREVLVAELLGEVDALLKRVEAFTPQIDAAHGRLAGSAGEMVSAIERYRVTIAALTEQAQASAVKHVVRRANEVCETSLAAHTEAMRAAARTAFDGETAARARQLTKTLDDAIARAQGGRWHAWLSHAATAFLSASTSAIVVGYLMSR
jgi:maltooligosyltrehalose synthase